MPLNTWRPCYLMESQFGHEGDERRDTKTGDREPTWSSNHRKDVYNLGKREREEKYTLGRHVQLTLLEGDIIKMKQETTTEEGEQIIIWGHVCNLKSILCLPCCKMLDHSWQDYIHATICKLGFICGHVFRGNWPTKKKHNSRLKLKCNLSSTRERETSTDTEM